MWGSKTKKKNAVNKWHSKAMLVDPKTTKITIVWAAVPETYETEGNLGTKTPNNDTADPNVIESPNAHAAAAEDLETADLNFGTVKQTVKITEPKQGTRVSSVNETPDFDETEGILETKELELEPLEKHVYRAQKITNSAGSLEDTIPNGGAKETNFETVVPDSAEPQITKKITENPETLEPRLQYTASNVVKAQNAPESAEDLGETKQNVGNMELNLPETSSTIDLSGAETNGTEAANNNDLADSTNDLMSAEEEPLNVKFLRALEKTRSLWYNDKQLAKIIQKMERGKNLKRKEFDKVYLHIRTHCQNH